MVLYHAISIYQILVCICLQINYHEKEESVCLLPDFIMEKYPEYKLLIKHNIFSQVILFPYREMPVTDSMEIVQMTGDKLCKRILPYPLEKFDDIYCAGTHFAFASYLVSKRISFNYLEDASGIYLNIEAFRKSHFKSHTIMYRLTERNGLYDGSCSYVKRIYADVSKSIASQNHRIVPFNIMKELGKIPFEHLREIRRAFGVSEVNPIAYDSSVVFITDPAGVLLTVEKQILRNTLTVDYFSHEKKLIIKPHPDDWIYHRAIFPEAMVMPRIFPIELMGNFMEAEETHIIAYNTAVLHNVRSCDVQTFDWAYQKGDFFKVHRYYAAYVLYKAIKDKFSCRFEFMGGNKTVFYNWARHDKDDILEYKYAQGNMCLFIGDNDFGASELESYLDHPISLIIMDELYDHVLPLVQSGVVQYIPKYINITSYGNSDQHIECVHVLTKNDDIRCEVERFGYRKMLKYTKALAKMEQDEAESYKCSILREILKVKEKQLVCAVQERNQLRSMLG